MMQGRRGLALLALAPAAALLVTLAGTGPVHATGTTITVTGFGDGAGTCPDATHCTTLRAAVGQANDDASGDTIVLPAGTYTLSNSDVSFRSLLITTAMTISGAGASTTTVQGVCDPESSWSSRLFTVETETAQNVLISGLTMTHGRAIDGEVSDGSADGGAVLARGMSRLALNHDVITANEAQGNGGGVAVDSTGATLATTDTIVKNNTAGSSANFCTPPSIVQQALADSDGGGVWSEGAATMTSSSVAGNVAGGNGGGVYLDAGPGITDTLTQLFVHGNSAMASLEQTDVGGGGVYADIAPTAGVTVQQSTISSNHATGGSGGGVYADFNLGLRTAAQRIAQVVPHLAISATTLNGNDAQNLGGGVYLHNAVAASMVNDTVTGNTARNGGGVAIGEAITISSLLSLESVSIDANGATGGQAGGLLVNDGTTTIHNSVVVLNSANPQVDVLSVTHNCLLGEAVLTSLGYNLADDTTCALTATGDQQPPTAVAALGPLQDNGGPTDGATGDTSPTLTQATTVGSTLLDSGDPVNFPATDERGITRPQTAPSDLIGLGTPKVAARAARVSAGTPRADTGAFEARVVPHSIPTPLPTSPTNAGGVQGVISVPSTGGGPEGDKATS
jgi:hypothetical protein